MAKKVVATLKKEGSQVVWAKVIRTVRSKKSGAYTFREDMVPAEQVELFLQKEG